MEFHEAVTALGERFKRLRINVVPHPPRDLPTSKSIFFGAIRKSRVTQDGDNEVRVTLFATVSGQTDGDFLELMELTDQVDDVIDAQDITGVTLTVVDGDEWDMGETTVGGVNYLGASVDVVMSY